MSIHRYAAKRDKNESEIIDALRSIGAQVVQVSQPGLMDLIVNRHGVSYFMEVKTKKGKLTPAQIALRETWDGQPISIVRTVEEAIAIVNGLYQKD